MAAQVDYFLQIEGVEGESTDSAFPNLIQVQHWTWSEENTGHWGVGSGAGAGKVQMGDFIFGMFTNKASPKLFLMCATGQHIPNAKLICRKSGNGQQQFLTITFTDGLVSSYVTRGSQTPAETAKGSVHIEAAGILPYDEIKINFARIEIEYRAQQDDGSLGAVVKAGYDLKLNAAV
jgi:type VI secretion system secreted protein Hcp